MNAARILFGILLAAIFGAPSLAGAAEAPCAEVSLEGDYRLNLPCPPGLRPLLEQLPKPRETQAPSDFAVDPKWPHDRAMVEDHDWPHDRAMVAPQENEEEMIPPLPDRLLSLLEPFLFAGRNEEKSRRERKPESISQLGDR